LTAGHIVGSVIRDQRSGPVPDGRGSCDRRTVVQRTSQDFRVEQLVQLVTDVGVHPSVNDGVGYGRSHGG